MAEFSSLDIDIMIGLDDVAHNRLSTKDEFDNFTPVANYGRRNKEYKCYCKILRKLGIRHGR
jgi:hypothetical protein